MLEITLVFNAVVCCNCHAVFAMPSQTLKNYRESHNWFHCPYCFSNQHFVDKSDKEILRDKLKSVENMVADLKNCCEITKRKLAATKGVVTKLKKRERTDAEK